jgi:hypothetical protein
VAKSKLVDELRKKYRSPRDALKALGLDESLIEGPRLANDAGRKDVNRTMVEALAAHFNRKRAN